jgi:hypothetical protein
MTQTILDMPDPRLQYQKTPVRVDIIESATLPDGATQSFISTTETGDTYKTLIAEAQPEIDAYTQKITELTAKDTAKSASTKIFLDAPTVDVAPSKLDELIAFLPDGTDVTDSEAVEAALQVKGELGVGCQGGCGRFWTLKPTTDMQSYTPKHDAPNIRQLPDGSIRINCDRCGHVTVLQRQAEAC